MSSNESSLKDLLSQFVNSKPIHDKYQQVQLKNVWKETLGATINHYTTDVRLYKGILTIVVSSAPLRQELLYSKVKIIDLLNQALGDKVVKDVRIM